MCQRKKAPAVNARFFAIGTALCLVKPFAWAGTELTVTKTIQTQRVCVPVRSSRAWSTAIAPNGRGGFNFITELFEYGSSNPVEYAVVDLETGKCSLTERPDANYANSNYQTRNQVRAGNGRIFFSEYGNVITYYDPSDEKIKSLGQVIDPSQGDKFFYKLEFGPDGMLYGGTQADHLPTAVRIDPDTLKFKVLGRVGKNRLSYSYAYNLAADPPWLYVGVGQSPWELAAINAETGESKVLFTCAGLGWIDFDPHKEGIVAKTVSNRNTANAKEEAFWCVDGKILPFQTNYDASKLSFKPRNVQRVSNPVSNAPELDISELDADSDGVCRVRLRPPGSQGPWKEVAFKVHHTAPIAIESLLALPDGTLLGNAKQYHGFFRYDPEKDICIAYGQHGPSQGPRTVMNNLVYICGYPNSVLFEYDPSKPWTSNRLLEQAANATTDLNPKRLGFFGAIAGTHYAYFLIPSRNGRLYFGGRRERTGIGGGVGYYEPATKKFVGHHEHLNFLTPRGMAVVDDLQRVVYSGQVQDDPAFPGQTPAEAQLVVYDMELKELKRLSVKPGLKETGRLFLCPPAPSSKKCSVIVGLDSAEKAMYRYDLANEKLLQWVPTPAGFNATIQKPDDGSLWSLTDGTLVRIDPFTLEINALGKLPSVTQMAWLGNRLYVTTGGGSGYAAGAELHRVENDDKRQMQRAVPPAN
jgi:hypothetical protein